ncbi:ribosome biogenesis GTP-binding protein YihA/YsxC [Slackia sp.]|uniref:ribosome biogenesis GTP-binding protein YihA/YsxC n=1 Tax=Slackia sp. TaxID=2049041 RepID=UPI00257F744F|nr:ribosome biogenesis GTP-binding protein YihA/YsxC [Slackia sp.]MBS6498740.1 ribosome biogenesis GTP-binding protein YihA/YsxC [Slackia sp.]
MNYHNVKFTAAYGTSKQLPPSTRAEVSFVGRSNVGKSSLMNKLFNRKKLAKVSATPGKTSTINFFEAEWADFVDLPGYGFAQVSKSEKARWREMIEGYYNQDRDFCCVVSLIDIRHPATALDVNMIEFLIAAELPFMIACTKADKLSKNKCAQSIAALRRQLGFSRDEVEIIPISSANGSGIDDLKAALERRIKAYNNDESSEE